MRKEPGKEKKKKIIVRVLRTRSGHDRGIKKFFIPTLSSFSRLPYETKDNNDFESCKQELSETKQQLAETTDELAKIKEQLARIQN
jgi:hypothetical protein